MARSALLATLLVAAIAAIPADAAPKDRITIGMVLEPPHLDSRQSPAEAIKDILYANVMEGLTRIDEKVQVEPLLADSWTISPDAKTYTFHLHKGVTFQDGTPFTSADVKFNLEQGAAPNSVNVLKRPLYSEVTGIETPDDMTVTVHLSKPDYLLLWKLGQGEAVLFSPKTSAEAKTHPVGTGPFRFVSWNKGDRIELARYKDYRVPDTTGLEHVTFRFIGDPAAIVASLLSGDVDAFPNGVPPENLPQFRADPRFTVDTGLTAGKTIMAMNNGRKPFNDLRVRRAIAYAIDRKAIIDGAEFGYGKPIGSHFSVLNEAYIDLTGMYPHDPEKAKALLREAGYPEGFSTTLKLPPTAYAQRSGEIIAQELAAVGIKASIVPMQWAQWLSNVFTQKDYDLTIVSHTEPLDIDIYSRPEYYFNYRNPKFNTIIDKIPTIPDQAGRDKLYKEAQRILAEDCVNAYLFQLPKLGVWNKNIVGLWKDAPIQAIDLTKVHWTE